MENRDYDTREAMKTENQRREAILQALKSRGFFGKNLIDALKYALQNPQKPLLVFSQRAVELEKPPPARTTGKKKKGEKLWKIENY